MPEAHAHNLPPGLYERLLAKAEPDQLERRADPRLYALAEVDPGDAHSAVAQYLEHLLAESLALFRGKDKAQRQRRLVDRVIATLIEELGADWAGRISLTDLLRRLLAVHAQALDAAPDRPDTPLSRSALLTSTRLDPSLASQLRKEIASADRVDILCSFVR